MSPPLSSCALWDAAGIRAAAEQHIRPSSLGALALCEGRALMEAAAGALDATAVEADSVAEAAESAEAAMGTRLHALAQQAVERWKLCQETGERGADPADAQADALEAAAEAGIDAWSLGCLRIALETVFGLIRQHGIEPEHALTEHHLDMAALGLRQGGTADLVLVRPGELVIVIDYKYGYVDQGDADEHDQLQSYAAAETFQAKQVLVYLIQPRAAKQHRVSAATFDAATLRANRAWTLAVTNLARGANPRLAAGYEQCKYCRALTRCPEARRHIMDTAEALEALGAPLDAAGLGQLADAAKLAEKFADAGKDLVKRSLEAGASADGWKLGSGRAIRSVCHVPEALRTLREAGMGAEAEATCSMALGKLPAEAHPLIRAYVSERISSPSLVQERRAKGAA